jgi:hypothetical protein
MTLEQLMFEDFMAAPVSICDINNRYFHEDRGKKKFPRVN